MKIVRTEELYSGRLRGVRETVRREDGQEFVYEVIHHPGAVVVLPILASGEVVLIQQYRHAIRGDLLELPAGTLEPGEPPATCAAREIKEEIGYGAGELVSLGMLYPAPGFCDEVQHIFLARELYPAFAEKDADEIIQVRPMTLDALESEIVRGGITDAKTLATICRARVMGFI